MLLVQVGEGMQDLHSLAHLVNRLLHLAFEQLVRGQEVAGLVGDKEVQSMEAEDRTDKVRKPVKLCGGVSG